ncbi:MAG: ABC transporter permease [Proteobacteria bacterium]|jgi:putative ABC transport system permease protein|nr:ABC transporter permease [Pseudomonadota bacterium]MDA1350753.1 ABC transporter permease [Pseudomonadota bacterium]
METIPLTNVALAFIPVMVVLLVMFRWSLAVSESAVALARMLIQLILIGYALNWIFAVNSSWLVLGLLSFMLIVASTIALRPLTRKKRWRDYGQALCAISCGGGATLAFIIYFVLDIRPWYQASSIIPIAGMIFAASMNAVSVAAERFVMETKHGSAPIVARNEAFKAGLIPIFNSLLAVGLVSLPGMMTGQILSGVPPLIAARYQIVVMCMITGASGISAAIYLHLVSKNKTA